MKTIQPFIVGIAGGTGSGKTTLANAIVQTLGAACASVIDADSYYRDLSHLPLQERHHINFDHPDALDAPLLIEHVALLRQGLPVTKQVYDFAAHARSHETITIDPKPVVIIEGILIFAIGGLHGLFDLRVFVDEDADIRLLRRMLRDIQERGRSVEMVAEQYLRFVKPMHQRFVEPSRAAADLVIHPGESGDAVIEIIKNAALHSQG